MNIVTVAENIIVHVEPSVSTIITAGFVGAPGATGLQGDPGIAGLKGDKGDPGIAGLKGDKGDPGVTGVAGSKGDKGDPGIAGSKGDKGDPGIAGTTDFNLLQNVPSSFPPVSHVHSASEISIGILNHARLPIRGPNPRSLIYIYDEFVGGGTAYSLNWANQTSGTGAANTAASPFGADLTQKAFGVAQLSTGTTATGRCALGMRPGGMADGLKPALGAAESTWRVAVDTLSSATEEFVLYFGILDSHAVNAEPTDGAYFFYNRALHDHYWSVGSAQGGVRTQLATTIAVIPGQFYWMSVVIDANWGNQDFYINDTFAGRINLSIVSPTSLAIKVEKKTGTTPRLAYIDCMDFTYFVSR